MSYFVGTPAVTFCYQVYAPNTDTHIPTATLLCYFRCRWRRNLSEINSILQWIVLTLSTLQMGIRVARRAFLKPNFKNFKNLALFQV